MDPLIGRNRFGGERKYHFESAQKGILTKVIYPTGGSTVFNYEPNKTQLDYAYLLKKDSISALIDTSTISGQEVYSDTFYVDKGWKELHVHGWCDWASDSVSVFVNGVYIDLPDAYKVFAFLLNGNDDVVWTGSILPGENFTDGNFDLALPSGFYRWKLVADRPRLKAKIVAERWWREIDRSSTGGIAGVRIKSISDFANTGDESNKREFIYGSWGDSSNTNSSGKGLVTALNHGSEVDWVRSWTDDGPNGHPALGGYNTISSNSVLSTFLTDNSTVVYDKVIELNTVSNGSKNNGGTEHEFYYQAKQNALPFAFSWNIGPNEIYPRVMPSLPAGTSRLNNDFHSGREKATRKFSYIQKHGARQILEEQFSYYSVDTPSLIIDTFFIAKWTGIIDDIINFRDYVVYDIYRTWRYFGFLKLDSTVQKIYSEPANLVNTVKFKNYSTQVFRPREVESRNSMAETKRILRDYAGDMPANTPINSGMRQKNMMDILLEEFQYKGLNTQLSHKQVDYNNQFADTAMFLPAVIKTSLSSSPDVTELTYNSYDDKGNLLQYTGRDGVINSIIWGYNKSYPVAKIVGKSHTDCSAVLNPSVINNPASDNELRTELNKLRTLLTGSHFVSTSTYSTLIGVTSETDPRGRTTYYSYDHFNRLSLIRDHDNNILKKVCYNYSGQVEECGIDCSNTSANWQNTSSPLTCEMVNNVNTGYQLQEQQDLNPCSVTYTGFRTVQAGVNGTACPATECLNITYDMQISSSGYTAVYTNTATSYVYTFSITSESAGTLGCIPAGNYNLTISKSGGTIPLYISTGCMSVSGTSGTFINMTVSSSACNILEIYLDL
jgi:YD repeat-containing protein